MIPEGVINILNDVFKKKTFRYEGPVMAYTDFVDIQISFDYTLKIANQKEMISVGQWKNFLFVDVTIKNYEGMFSPIFNIIYNTDSFRLVLTYKLNEVTRKLGFTDYFSVKINDIILHEDGL